MTNDRNISELQGKKVLIVFGSLELGGAERQGLQFGRYLKESQGCHVEVWGFNSPGRSTEICKEAGIAWKIVPLPFSGNLLQGWWRYIEFVQHLRRLKPDVLLPYTTVPNLCCALARRWSGAKLCIWNQRDEGLERMKPSRERKAIRRASYFIANATVGAEYLKNQHGVSNDRIRVIRNGIELPGITRDRSIWRNKLGLQGNDFLVCMLANFTPFKDHQTLIKAWPYVVRKLKEQGRSAKLILAGHESTTFRAMQDLTLTMGVEDSVIFPGPVRDVHQLLQSADLVAFSSVLEGCPNGVLEGMAAGLPVVATDIPGIREAVGDAGIQYLVPPRDEQKLAEVITLFALDPVLRNAVGHENRKRIAEHFSVQRMQNEMTELINRLLSSWCSKSISVSIIF